MAYDVAEWSDLYVGVAGAAAAFAGLLFVALSINVEKILAYAWLPVRAAETLAGLLAVLLLSIVVLVPGQARAALAAELLLLGAALVTVALISRARIRAADRDGPRAAIPQSLTQVITIASGLALVVAGASLYVEVGGGLYWTVPTLILGFCSAALNAWVLLVEILR